MSMLFQMEKLFEKYVERWLGKNLLPLAKLTPQAKRHSLCQHEQKPIFRLEPDLLVERHGQSWVLDTKWKRLNAADRQNKYGLNQADFYQLFAYGQKYLGGQGELVLIYPRWAWFQSALPLFDFGGGLTLRALPFDLERNVLVDAELTSLPLCSLEMSGYLKVGA